MALENKVFKKFSFYDERFKNYDKDIFKLKEDTRNNMSIIDGMKHIAEKSNQQLKENNENDEYYSQLKEKIELFENQLKNIKSNGVLNNENKINELITQKMKENEENIKNMVKKEIIDKEINLQKTTKKNHLLQINYQITSHYLPNFPKITC